MDAPRNRKQLDVDLLKVSEEMALKRFTGRLNGTHTTEALAALGREIPELFQTKESLEVALQRFGHRAIQHFSHIFSGHVTLKQLVRLGMEFSKFPFYTDISASRAFEPFEKAVAKRLQELIRDPHMPLEGVPHVVEFAEEFPFTDTAFLVSIHDAARMRREYSQL